jgi:predicted PurR-regulated permease PerM
MNLTPTLKGILSIAGIVLLLWMLYFFRSIVAYFLVAAVVAFICEPLSEILRKWSFRGRTMPSWLRASVALTVLCSLLLGVLALFAPLVISEVELLSSIDPYATANELQERIEQWRSSGSMLAQAMGDLDLRSVLPGLLSKWLAIENISGAVDTLVSTLTSLSVGVFSVFFMAFFFLKDGMLFNRIVLVLTPDQRMDSVKTILQHSHGMLRRYFIGLALQSLIMGTIVGVGLWIFGIENALIIGILAGVLNVVPYLGPLIAFSLGAMVAITTALHLQTDAAILPLLVKVASVFIVAQTVDGFVVQPLVLGSIVRAHPLEIYVVVLAAGLAGGAVAMMVAIPGYTILRVVAKEFFDEFKVVESLTRGINKED